MLRILLKNNLKSLLASTGKGKKGISKLLVYILVAVIMVASFTPISIEFASILIGIGQSKAFISMFGMLMLGTVLITNVVMAQNQLYESNYNDFLLSLPIRERTIIVSRIINMLLFDYFYELLIVAVALVGWYYVKGAFDFVWLRMLAVSLFWPGITLAVSAMIGYALHKVSAKVKNKSLVKTAFLLVFMAAYYYFSFNLQNYIMSLEENSSEFAGFLNSFSLSEWFGSAVLDGKPLSFILIILVNLISMAMMILFISKTFISTVTGSITVARAAYKEKTIHQNSLLFALMKREWKRLLNYFTYLVNNILAPIMGVASLVYVIISWNSIVSVFGEVFGSFGRTALLLVIILAELFQIGTYFISTSSVSLEGKSYDTLKSLPVSSVDILNSKILFHWILIGPLFLIASIILAVMLKPGMIPALTLIVLPQAYLLLTGELGLCYNLLWPKLDWTNEAQPVKRSAAMFVSMVSNYVIIALYVLVVMISDSVNLNIVMLSSLLLTVVLAAGAYFLIVKWGTGRLERLEG